MTHARQPGSGSSTPATLIALLILLMQVPCALGQEIATNTVSAKGTIDRVVIYPSSAAVTRVVHEDLAQGLWIIRITNLPEGVSSNQLQAKIRSSDVPNPNTPKLLGVEYEETPGVEFSGSAEGIEMAKRLDAMQKEHAQLLQQSEILKQSSQLAEKVGVRAVANATADGATAKQDVSKTLEQLAWVQSERERILTELRVVTEKSEEVVRKIDALQSDINRLGGSSRMQRTALVKIAAPVASPCDLDFTYLVPNAAWAPAYSIRAAGDRSGVNIEYDAMLAQQTGEEWKDVRISLSTADPVRAAQPEEVQPLYVDLEQPVIAYGMATGSGGGFVEQGPGGRREAKDKMVRSRRKSGGFTGQPSEKSQNNADDRDAGLALEELSREAQVSEAGIAATFELPRRVTVASDGKRKQRTRISTLEPEAKFVYTAQPIVTEGVFLRGDLMNASGYQLLPGTAQVFMGGDFIGETAMPSVAPKARFQVYFGADRSVRAARQVISKVTGKEGLFGGSIATTWKYRVTIDNGTGRDISVELLDRRAVSRNEKIQIKVADLSAPLSTDPEYLAGPQKQGILRWQLTVPASARGPALLPITWTVQATYGKDVETTPLPD